MAKYTSTTYYIFDYILYLIIFSVITGLITYFLRDKEAVLFGGVVLLVIQVLLIVRLVRKLAKIEFDDKTIKVTYIFPRKEVLVDYSSIKEIIHIFGYNMSSVNFLKYYDREVLIKFKMTPVVAVDEYLEFVKWLKRKNNQIEFKFLPSDSKLSIEYANVNNDI